MANPRVLNRAGLLALACLMAGTASCLAQEPAYVFEVDSADCQLEGDLPVSFTNKEDQPVGIVMACFTWLQGRRQEVWVDLFTPDCSNVRVFPLEVLPDETVEAVFPLAGADTDTLAGWEAFRLRSSLYRQGEAAAEIFSEPFDLP